MAANLLFILALQLYVITDAFKSSTAALSTTSAGSVVEKSTVNGNLGDWSYWSTCTSTCEVGNRVRTRVCNNPKTARGGTDCVGETTEKQPCKEQDCPVNGNFSDWSIWSSCSLTCGLGVRIRERFCNNPKPAYGGTVCPGDSRQKRWCKERDCPVIGYFSDWSIWSHCTLTCGTGNQSRRRSCDNPEPAAHGGRDCVGESTEMQSCNEHECPEENSCCTCASGIASIIIGAVMGVVIVILAAYSLYVTILLRRKKVDEDLASRGRNQHHNYVDQEFNSDAAVAKEEPSVKESSASENQGCADVELISDAISTIFKKADVDKTSIMLQDKIKQMEKIINIRVALFKQLMDSKTEAITAIQQFKTEMELILQNLLKESINEVEEECCKREMILEEEKKKAESEVETMQLADDNLRQSDANRAQQFVNMKIAQQQVTSVDAIIGSMETLSDAQLTFTEDENIRDTLRRLKTLGTVYRFSPFKPRTIAYTHTGTSDMDARLANDKSICNIISSCLTARDMLLLADNSNQKLKNVDISKMSVVDQCDLPSHPFCLCAAREHEAVVCLGNDTIQFVSLADKMKLTSHLSLGHTFYGIAYKAEKLFVTDNGHFLYIYDMKGNQLLKVSHDTSGNKIFKSSEQIIFNDDGDKLQIVDWSNRIVTLDTNGKYINIISDSDIAQAHGICTDGRGNVFVCGHGSNNVIQIGKNGEKLGVLLKSSNGLSSPWSVCFDPRRCILFVFNERSDRVKVFYLQ